MLPSQTRPASRSALGNIDDRSSSTPFAALGDIDHVSNPSRNLPAREAFTNIRDTIPKGNQSFQATVNGRCTQPVYPGGDGTAATESGFGGNASDLSVSPTSPPGEFVIDEDDIVVVVMGLSGSGRSTFINRAVGRPVVSVGHGLVSCTAEVRLVRYPHSDGIRNFVLVDTPPFDDTFLTDVLVLEKIAHWLKVTYEKNIKLSGVLYFQRISDNRLLGTQSKYLDIFKELCGEENFKNVLLVTTMWGEVIEAVGSAREKELQCDSWRSMINLGSTIHRFEGTGESAWKILDSVSVVPPVGRQPLQIQREMVDEYVPFQWTAAARAVGTPTGLTARVKRTFKRLTFRFTKNDYVIFVVGLTKADSNWFTFKLFVDHNFPAEMIRPDVLRCSSISSPANIVVVSIPQFPTDHQASGDEDALTSWLKSTFSKKCHSGIILLYSLDSDPADGDVRIRHLEEFAKALPKRFPPRVHVVPTSERDSTLPSEGRRRLETTVSALDGDRSRRWNASMFPGVFYGQPETAWNATLLLLKDMTKAKANGFCALSRSAFKHMPAKPSDARLALKDFPRDLLRDFRNKRSGDLGGLITLARTALEFIPLDDPQRHSVLTDLADLLSERFKLEPTSDDLDEIITLRRDASEYMSSDNPQRQLLLQLDDYLYERFKRGDSMVDLEEIISLRRAVLERTPPPERCKPLLNLANALHERFRKQDLVNDINEAVDLADTAFGLCPPGDPHYLMCRDHLVSYRKAKVRARAARAHASDTSSPVTSDIKQLVKKVFSEKVEKLPPRLLHTRTAVLCDRDAQLSHFERSPQYMRLLSSTFPPGSQQLETETNTAITEFFGFAMLSHRWGSGEPLLRDVEGKDILDLGGTDGLLKLQEFCNLAFQHDLQWAWSDTCCIDKDSSAELQEAIGSMFSWYHLSSLTIVYLSDVVDTGSLAKSAWFKRGWTLQELLAPRTVLFYMHDWSLYMKSDAVNHKTDPALLEELQKATGISKQHLMKFDPGMDDARSRLHWASGRRTTRPEDIAYSLFGIFEVHLPVIYGESAQNALGRLLAEIISRSGDVSVLDWVGEPSSFNSCFPADLVPYRTEPQTEPHTPVTLSDSALLSDLDPEKVHQLHSNLTRLPRAGCVNNKLLLPSIAYPVTVVRLQGSSASSSRCAYEMHASRLRPLNIAPSVKLDESVDYVLVRPWHPKPPEQQTNRDVDVWKLLEQLEQPFNALLLKKSLHNEYKRVACDCTITTRVQDLAGVLDSEVLIAEIV